MLPLATLLSLYLLSVRKTYSIRGKHVLVSGWSNQAIACNAVGPCTRTQITGGSSGIGKCLAIDAIKRGAGAVTIVARNKVGR